MVSTYTEWKEALERERRKLLDVFSYLNERGQERNRALQLLQNFSEFCDSASEMVKKMNDPRNLSDEEEATFKAADARAAIRALKRVAELETAATTASDDQNSGAEAKAEEAKSTYYVTFRVDARFVAPVDAGSVEEALKEAQTRFSDANFGEAEDIDGEPIVVENEDGDYLWER